MMIQIPKEVLKKVKIYLEEQLTRVEAQIIDLSKQDPFADKDRLSDNAASDTEANEEIGHERFEALISQLKQIREQVVLALEQIKNGKYGTCVHCQKHIDTDRLIALPTATLCMHCQSMRLT